MLISLIVAEWMSRGLIVPPPGGGEEERQVLYCTTLHIIHCTIHLDTTHYTTHYTTHFRWTL